MNPCTPIWPMYICSTRDRWVNLYQVNHSAMDSLLGKISYELTNRWWHYHNKIYSYFVRFIIHALLCYLSSGRNIKTMSMEMESTGVFGKNKARECMLFIIDSLTTGICSGSVNTLRPRHNGRCFPDDIFKCIFLTENVWILNTISLKFVRKGPKSNNPELVQIMAWRRPGDKPLSEPMMVRFPMHLCITRPQWVKSVISKHMKWINSISNFYEVVIRSIPQNILDDQSTLVQIMPKHYLIRHWPRPVWLYCVTKPQWVNGMKHGTYSQHMGYYLPWNCMQPILDA